ncbi:hypothetical protein CR203_18105 [Salipaludibacillus neizhouensis]|uniref:SSD domain-containing protein n=1 Tax=Salipaludibacillus neizhouensis TaxID=885475 RepID=A0A3A9K8L5_9BACI|nr:MMPL family transporter [Salipaludibacillus neizhouensis]RKL65983.1 hypothetical protein CR203_18105 [Salipaludibacillus neizhouensis]
MSGKFRWIYLLPIIWIIIGVGLYISSPDMDQLVREHGQFTISEEYPSQVTKKLLEEHKGATGESILVVYYDEEGLSENQKGSIENKLSKIGSDIESYPIIDIVSPFESSDQAEFLISEDETTLMSIVSMDISINDIPLVRDDIEEAVTVDDVQHYMTGSSIIEDDVIISSEEGLAATEIITVIFVVIILFFVFRSLAAPFVPLITVGATYFVTISIVSLLIDNFQFPVSNFTQIFIVAILFGIGTDYCILLLNRFKEELAKEPDRVKAIKNTYKAVGATVISSALTGFIGFAAIGMAEFDLYQSAVGVAIGIVILVIALWVWVPCAMLLLGDKLFWPSKQGVEMTQSRLWNRLGKFSVYKPGWTLVILALLLIPSALLYEQKLTYDSLDEIGNDFDSVQGIDLVAEKFGEGHSFPIEVVMLNDQRWDQQSMLPYVELISNEIAKLDEVAEVRSATRPEGTIIEDFRVPSIAGELFDALEEMDEGLVEIHDALIEIRDDIQAQDTDLSEASTGTQDLVDGTQELQTGNNQLAESVSDTAQATEESASGLNQLQSSLSELQGQLDQFSQSEAVPAAIGEQLAPFSGGMNEVASGITNVEGGLRELSEAQQTISNEMNSIGTGLSEMEQGQQEITDAFDDIQGGYVELANAMDELTEGVADVEDGLADVMDILDELSTQSQPLEGFFVPQTAFDDGELDEIWDIFTSPNRQLTTFDVVLAINPYSNEAMAVVSDIERQIDNALKGTELEDITYSLGGLAVVNQDLKTISDEDFNRTAIIMLTGIFIVLVVLLKSLVMPVYIIASLILTYIASMAFTELIFIHILGYSGISWAVPFFGFVMLMALGVDYSIFLMGRFGENVRVMPIKEALVSSMTQIGTVVLSAAIILAGTFGAMMPSGVLSLLQIGTLVLTGLLIYAVIMLPLFIPMMVTMFGEKNWLPFKRPEREDSEIDR